MKHLYTIGLILSVCSCFGQGWVQKGNFDGTARYSASAFTINGKGYVGTGWDGTVNQNDLWEYDPSDDSWTQKANFIGAGRAVAVGFAIGGKGYIGTGENNGCSGRLNDFYEYTPSPTNAWTAKQPFGGAPRYNAVGFSIGTKGYIGTGSGTSSNCNDSQNFWEYDPVGDSWTPINNIPGARRRSAVGFSIDTDGDGTTDRGYVATGIDASVFKDVYEYNPSTGNWTTKNNFPGNARRNAIAFSIGTKGYMGLGNNDAGTHYNDFWEYDPSGDSWTQLCNFGGAARSRAIAIEINGKGYIGLGENGAVLKDYWEAQPACGGALPTELLFFFAKWQDENYTAALLEWETESEINNDFFELEKSIDGTNFEIIAEIDGAGNSSQKLTYEYIDDTPYKDGTSYYRLKQTDFDGSFTYSSIEILNAFDGLDIINLFPNPVNDILQFSVASSIQEKIDINIFNPIGQKVMSIQDEVEKGLTPFTIDLPHLGTGNYYIEVKVASGKYKTQEKFIVSRND